MQIYLARNNQQAGPYSLDDVNEMLANQQVLLTDLAWHEGMSEWKALGELTQGKLVYQPQATPSVQTTPQFQNQTSTIQNIEVKKTARTQVKAASVGKRIGAKLIDLVLFFFPQFIFLFTYIPFDLLISKNATSFEEQMKIVQDTLVSTVPEWVPLSIIAYILILLFTQSFMIKKYGQSIGKKIYKLKIVDIETNENPGQLRGFFVRSFLFLVISQMMNFFPFLIIIFIADIVMFFSKENISLHDRLAKTKVIDISN
ncbi:RDD family protein [Acinetobacter gerneri]|uniref:RDD family protein n=1 Tax=Acinetobacter gerneri TaxID=202952 RepID=UPI0029367B8A|nr:RDD family protein [Acinetobacter gerneri]MDV2441429.1 RDD family protein [Acinetobacter gerneri]